MNPNKEIWEALVKAGLVAPDERVYRVIIDLQVGHVPMVHIERAGDEKLLEVFPAVVGLVGGKEAS